MYIYRNTPPNRDWIESRIVRTLYTADHFSCRSRKERGMIKGEVQCYLVLFGGI